MQTIASRLASVKHRIDDAVAAAGRDPAAIQLLAVSKFHAAEAVRAAWAAGQREFGESYVQEALAKQDALADLPIVWHFIGPIQSNKTKAIATRFSWVHSVDRDKIARRLSEARAGMDEPLNVLIEVNVSGEASKSGVGVDEVPALADLVTELPGLTLRGLMAIPQWSDSLEEQRRPFHRLARLLNELKEKGHNVDTLSMGMSADLEAAVMEGATIVRVGEAIFGPRT